MKKEGPTDIELTPLRQAKEPAPVSLYSPKNNNSQEPAQQTPTLFENVSFYFSQYCGATSVHGIQYIGERGRYAIEKITWLIIIIFVWIGCIYLISRTYHKWVTSPVIVSFATTETQINKIPFPAITICPEVKCDASLFNITGMIVEGTKNQTPFTPEQKEYMQNLILICDGEIIKHFRATVNTTVSSNAIDILWELAEPIFNESYWGIRWLGDEIKFRDSFLTFTETGFCFTFNNLHETEILKDVPKPAYIKTEIKPTKGWSFEGGYDAPNELDVYPRRTFTSGISGGASIEIQTDGQNLDYICGNSLQGHKVLVHHPAELPSMEKYFRLPLDSAVNVAIIPKMITVSETLKNYSPQQRKCFYSYERPLKYFKLYTQNNCIFECISNYTLKNCGCTAFYMPRFEHTPVCKPANQDCVEESKIKYSYSVKNPKTGKKSLGGCDCLPPCTSLQYDIEISQTAWNWRPIKHVLALFNRTLEPAEDRAFFSSLSVYFKESQFLSSERNELYGYVDFFSNTGGLLGLFIGFSVTSIIEIIHFLSLRLICNVRKYGKQYWAGEELIESKKSE